MDEVCYYKRLYPLWENIPSEGDKIRVDCDIKRAKTGTIISVTRNFVKYKGENGRNTYLARYDQFEIIEKGDSSLRKMVKKNDLVTFQSNGRPFFGIVISIGLSIFVNILNRAQTSTKVVQLSELSFISRNYSVDNDIDYIQCCVAELNPEFHILKPNYDGKEKFFVDYHLEVQPNEVMDDFAYGEDDIPYIKYASSVNSQEQARKRTLLREEAAKKVKVEEQTAVQTSPEPPKEPEVHKVEESQQEGEKEKGADVTSSPTTAQPQKPSSVTSSPTTIQPPNPSPIPSPTTTQPPNPSPIPPSPTTIQSQKPSPIPPSPTTIQPPNPSPIPPSPATTQPKESTSSAPVPLQPQPVASSTHLSPITSPPNSVDKTNKEPVHLPPSNASTTTPSPASSYLNLQEMTIPPSPPSIVEKKEERVLREDKKAPSVSTAVPSRSPSPSLNSNQQYHVSPPSNQSKKKFPISRVLTYTAPCVVYSMRENDNYKNYPTAICLHLPGTPEGELTVVPAIKLTPGSVVMFLDSEEQKRYNKYISRQYYSKADDPAHAGLSQQRSCPKQEIPQQRPPNVPNEPYNRYPSSINTPNPPAAYPQYPKQEPYPRQVPQNTVPMVNSTMNLPVQDSRNTAAPNLNEYMPTSYPNQSQYVPTSRSMPSHPEQIQNNYPMQQQPQYDSHQYVNSYYNQSPQYGQQSQLIPPQPAHGASQPMPSPYTPSQMSQPQQQYVPQPQREQPQPQSQSPHCFPHQYAPHQAFQNAQYSQSMKPPPQSQPSSSVPPSYPYQSSSSFSRPQEMQTMIPPQMISSPYQMSSTPLNNAKSTENEAGYMAMDRTTPMLQPQTYDFNTQNSTYNQPTTIGV